jgi:hypothetical protein
LTFNLYFSIIGDIMGIMPAWVTTTNTNKKKRKFASAEQARKAREQAESWELLKRKYDVKDQKRNNEFVPYVSKSSTPPRGESVRHPSRDTGGGHATKPNVGKVYTGTKIIGIGTLHKSNAVPIFSNDEAKEIARMRRG